MNVGTYIPEKKKQSLATKKLLAGVRERVSKGLTADGSINWMSPSGPTVGDSTSIFIGMAPIPNSHPPSLKNPIHVKIPTGQEGWTRGSSKAAREQAESDLVALFWRMMRQPGKPVMSETVLLPAFPKPTQWD